MAIYSYYYGASAGSGIGIRAMTSQLGNLAIRSDLKDLASLHALESTDHDGEMLSYLLQRDGFSILGLSYIESPKSSGYGRSAPCGLQYVVSDADMKNVSADLGGIVNFISFQKPTSASPAPLAVFPMNESGYYYHNSSAVLAPLVDGLVRVALSTRQEVLLVALPKGKSNEYATARYTIAEALNYLPVLLRQKIRFFTGLPVGEGVTDALVGYDNAVKYNANVIFCPNEYFEKLKGYRSFIGLDMDRPDERVGTFAGYIAQTLTPSENLSQIACCLNGPLTYDSLNQAAQRVQRGELITMDMLKSALDRSEKRCSQYEQQTNKQYQELINLQNAYNELQAQQQQYYNQDMQWESGAPQGKGILSKILLGFCVILLMALTGFAAWIGATHVYTGHFFPPKETGAAATDDPVKSDIFSQETDEQMQVNVSDVTPVPVVTTPESFNEQTSNADDTAEQVNPTETPGPVAVLANQDELDLQAASEEVPNPEEWEQQEESGEVEDKDKVEETQTPASILGMNNRYGITNTNVNFREGNSQIAKWIKELSKNTKVWMVKTELNDSEEQWTEVYVNGQHGYLKTQYIDIMTPEESTAYDAAQPSPVPEEMYADSSR